MKKILLLSILFLLLVSINSSVFAEDTTRGEKLFDKTSKIGSKTAIKEEKIEEKMTANKEKLQERAEKEINRRIESLNKLITKINDFKKLSETQKSSLTTQIQAEITSLQALLVKIQEDTDIDTLKEDIKSIVSSYRIYALFIPKIQIITAADRLLYISDKMSSQAALLETKIDQSATSGNNVSELNILLADMNTKIVDAKNHAQSAIDAVTPLTPEGFPGNKSILQSARQMVVSSLHDLNTARQDARKILVGLLKFEKLETSPTVTTTP